MFLNPRGSKQEIEIENVKNDDVGRQPSLKNLDDFLLGDASPLKKKKNPDT